MGVGGRRSWPSHRRPGLELGCTVAGICSVSKPWLLPTPRRLSRPPNPFQSTARQRTAGRAVRCGSSVEGWARPGGFFLCFSSILPPSRSQCALPPRRRSNTPRTGGATWALPPVRLVTLSCALCKEDQKKSGRASVACRLPWAVQQTRRTAPARHSENNLELRADAGAHWTGQTAERQAGEEGKKSSASEEKKGSPHRRLARRPGRTNDAADAAVYARRASPAGG